MVAYNRLQNRAKSESQPTTAEGECRYHRYRTAAAATTATAATAATALTILPTITFSGRSRRSVD